MAAEKDKTLADEKLDVWGHLPPSRRKEMDAFSRERFVPRYEEVLRQYYRSIAENSRRPPSGYSGPPSPRLP